MRLFYVVVYIIFYSINLLTFNYIRRILVGSFPYAVADSDGYYEENTNEDNRKYPPINGCLQGVVFQPMLHNGIANSKGNYRSNHQ